MPSSESDWNVAARDSLTLSELLMPAVASEQRRRQRHESPAQLEQLVDAR